MTEDFVTYEQALALKRCGFDWPCDHSNPDCTAIPLWLAAKWLREVKRLSVEPYVNIAVAWNYNISDLDDFANLVGGGVSYTSYEQALSAGITTALELIDKK